MAMTMLEKLAVATLLVIISIVVWVQVSGDSEPDPALSAKPSAEGNVGQIPTSGAEGLNSELEVMNPQRPSRTELTPPTAGGTSAPQGQDPRGAGTSGAAERRPSVPEAADASPPAGPVGPKPAPSELPWREHKVRRGEAFSTIITKNFDTRYGASNYRAIADLVRADARNSKILGKKDQVAEGSTLWLPEKDAVLARLAAGGKTESEAPIASEAQPKATNTPSDRPVAAREPRATPKASTRQAGGAKSVLGFDDAKVYGFMALDRPVAGGAQRGERAEPGVVPEFHVVGRGDNPAVISKKYYGNEGMGARIMELNQVKDATKLQLGQRLKLPRP